MRTRHRLNIDYYIDIDYLYANSLSESKCHLLISKLESVGLKYFNGSKAYIKNSNDMVNIY